MLPVFLHTLVLLCQHGFILLLLGIAQDRFNFLIARIADAAHLAMAILGRHGAILPESAHLLIAVLQNRQNLLLLVRSQIQLFCHALQLRLRIHAMAMTLGCSVVTLGWKRRAIVLRRVRTLGVLGMAENRHTEERSQSEEHAYSGEITK